MQKPQPIFVQVISYLFVLLFVYAAVSKLLDFENFRVQLAQSPLLSAYAGVVSYGVIALELVISLLLLVPKTRKAALYASFGLMVAFTVYIYLILNYSDFVPCSCGGILEKMGWKEHLVFNVTTVILAGAAVLATEKEKNKHTRKLFLRGGLTLLLLALLSSGIIVALFFSSEYIIKKENNFTRRFLFHPILEKKTITLDNSSYYFAGFDNSSVYLGNRQYPLSLTTINSEMEQQRKVFLVPDNLAYHFKNISVEVKTPDVYIYDGTVPVILKSKLGSTSAKTISFDDAYFTQLAIIDSSKFLLRTQSIKTKNLVVGQMNLDLPQKLRLDERILTRQVDGVFDMDGSLISDAWKQNFLYIYAYRNQFIVFDKDLHIRNRLNTIDTIKNAQIKTVILSDGTHKMSRPPLKVNNFAAAYKGLLFNQSTLIGKYESKKDWNNAYVVDIYKTDSQNYIGSFYIYKKHNQKLNSFIITNKYLYIILDNKLIQYEITGRISKYFS